MFMGLVPIVLANVDTFLHVATSAKVHEWRCSNASRLFAASIRALGHQEGTISKWRQETQWRTLLELDRPNAGWCRRGTHIMTLDRVRLSVAEARSMAEDALRGIGYPDNDARIIADHVIDAALCGYEYSGLAKILNIPDSEHFRQPRRPVKVLRETGVSLDSCEKLV